jgi:hypothetical protein
VFFRYQLAAEARNISWLDLSFNRLEEIGKEILILTGIK